MKAAAREEKNKKSPLSLALELRSCIVDKHKQQLKSSRNTFDLLSTRIFGQKGAQVFFVLNSFAL